MERKNITRHVGKMSNTGQKVVVVFRTLPADEQAGTPIDTNHALVVYSDQLPDMYHENVMTLVNSQEAQQSHDLYNIFHRRLFGDGANILATLHQKGFLHKVSIDDVILYPMPNVPLLLRRANDEIDGTSTTENETIPVESPVPENDVVAHAASLLAQSELLSAEAKAKREQAYSLDPTLRPTSKTKKDKADRDKLNKKRREQYAKEKADKTNATTNI